MKKIKIPCNVNTEQKYAIVDEDGNILEKFRLYQTACQMIHYYKNKYLVRNLKIVEI